jgi:hypothetical protein
MTATDATFWALAAAILAIAGGITFFLLRLGGTVGRVNRILDETSREIPATVASARRTVENAERISGDLAAASAVVRDGAEAVRVVVDRVRETVKFFDENVFSKLSALAPVVATAGAFLGRFVASRKSNAEKKEPNESPDSGG